MSPWQVCFREFYDQWKSAKQFKQYFCYSRARMFTGFP